MTHGDFRMFGRGASLRGVLLLGVVLFGTVLLAGSLLVPVVRKEISARLGQATVAQRLDEVEPRVRPFWEVRTRPKFESFAAIASLTVLVFKQERELLVYAHGAGSPKLLATYKVLAASGELGPKLREGDRQVPEGLYAITFLNPNSRYRLSMRLGYPSEEDIRAARSDGRDIGSLGSDIMIHGGDRSIGCVAIGDPEIEEVFWLVAKVGIENTQVIISPSRSPLNHIDASTPPWLKDRYERVAAAISALGEQPNHGSEARP